MSFPYEDEQKIGKSFGSSHAERGAWRGFLLTWQTFEEWWPIDGRTDV